LAFSFFSSFFKSFFDCGCAIGTGIKGCPLGGVSLFVPAHVLVASFDGTTFTGVHTVMHPSVTAAE